MICLMKFVILIQMGWIQMTSCTGEENSENAEIVQIQEVDSSYITNSMEEKDNGGGAQLQLEFDGNRDFVTIEPSVEITEEPKENEAVDSEDIYRGMEAGRDTQYVGEEHDFSELYAKFCQSGDEDVQCNLTFVIMSLPGWGI